MAKGTCSVEGCERRQYARSWCTTHYLHHLQAERDLRPDTPRCRIDGCGKIATAHGFCNVHYQRWRRLGDPLKTLTHPKTIAERVWEKVDKSSDCWLWTGYIEPKSRRGKFHDKRSRTTWRAYRLVWELERGPIPKGMELDHLCRNPTCVRPDHLEVVTPHENKMRQVAAWRAAHGVGKRASGAAPVPVGVE